MEYSGGGFTGFNHYAAAATLLAVITLLWWRMQRRPSPPLPPGPRGLPLVGNLLSLSPHLHVHFTKLIGTYGPIFRIRFGHKLCIVISSPALAREALRDNDVTMANHDVSSAVRVIDYGGNVLFNPIGAEWTMLRRIMVQRLLNPATLDELYGARRREVRTAVAHLRGSAGKEVDMGVLIFVTVANSMLSMGGAGRMEEGMREGKELRELVGEITALFEMPNVSDFYPALERFDLMGLQRKMRGLIGRMDRFIYAIIDRKRKKMREREINDQGGGGLKKDFLEHILDLEQDGGNSETPFTMPHLKGLLLSIIIGGTHTTSTTLEWAMAEILWNPEIMRRAQEELDQIVGKDNIVEGSHIPELRYIRAVIKEALRLHPVSPFLVPHATSESCTVGGYTVPKGSMIFFNVWAIQRDPSLWKDPLTFCPERFLDNSDDISGNLELKGNSDFRYFPFGSGRRMCIGIGLVERMAVHILASILHSFDLEGIMMPTDIISKRDGLIFTDGSPLVVVPTPRLQNPQQYC